MKEQPLAYIFQLFLSHHTVLAGLELTMETRLAPNCNCSDPLTSTHERWDYRPAPLCLDLTSAFTSSKWATTSKGLSLTSIFKSLKAKDYYFNSLTAEHISEQIH